MTPSGSEGDFVLKHDVTVAEFDDRPCDIVTLQKGTPLADIPEGQMMQLAPDHFESGGDDDAVPEDWRPDEQRVSDMAHEEEKAKLQAAIDLAREDGVPFDHNEYVEEMEANR
jgi:hypothetical protein